MAYQPEAACHAMAKWLKGKRENGPPPPMEPDLSYKKTSECPCEFCGIVTRVLGAPIGKARIPMVEGRDAKDTVSFSMDGSGMRFYYKSLSIKVFVSLKVEIFVLQHHKLDYIPVASTSPGYTGSEKSLATVNNWMVQCLTTHETLCPNFRNLHALPTRVLDVAPGLGYDVRLVEVTDEIGYYAALSHCWGPKEHQPIRTTLKPDTLSQFKAGIKLDELPRTFRDVVELTRQLSLQYLRYLWIDSLCIIQDSKEDWQIESSRMATIYSNAVVTFSASVAPDGRYGLYSSADEGYIDCPLSRVTGHEQDEAIRIREPLPHRPDDHPLMGRAWAFQERLLSPRLIHFGRHELVWECMEHTTCECSGLTPDSVRQSDWLEPKTLLNPKALMNITQAQRIDYWHKIVMDYSKMGLTNGSDILPAISGVAQKMKCVNKGKYLAGLWEDSLAWDLCWRIPSPTAARRPCRWRAPTFSWASVVPSKSGISYHAVSGIKISMRWRPVRQHVEFQGGACSTLSIDETGAVSGGYLDLQGRMMIKGTLVQTPAGPRSHKWNFGIPRRDGESPSITGQFYPDYDFAAEDPYHVTIGQVVYCLKIFSLEGPTRNTLTNVAVYLTLRDVRSADKTLSHVCDGAVDVYERIGLFQDSRDEEESVEKLVMREDVMENVKIRII